MDWKTSKNDDFNISGVVQNWKITYFCENMNKVFCLISDTQIFVDRSYARIKNDMR
jgi:hypothetical protein